MFDDDEALTFDLGYAIWRAMRKRVPIDDCRRMAAAILQHLKLCRWTWKREPPRDS